MSFDGESADVMEVDPEAGWAIWEWVSNVQRQYFNDFDTETGPKRDAESYRCIASAIEVFVFDIGNPLTKNAKSHTATTTLICLFISILIWRQGPHTLLWCVLGDD